MKPGVVVPYGDGAPGLNSDGGAYGSSADGWDVEAAPGAEFEGTGFRLGTSVSGAGPVVPKPCCAQAKSDVATRVITTAKLHKNLRSFADTGSSHEEKSDDTNGLRRGW